MLVLTRKTNECVVIGSTIQVCVLETHKDRVKLGFTGPPEVPIHREEVYERIKVNGKNARCLGTQQPSSLLVYHQLQQQRSCGRHEVGLIWGRGHGGNHFVTQLSGGCLTQPSSGNTIVEDFADGAAENPGEDVVSTADVVRGDASLLVCRRAQRHVAWLAGEQIGALNAISGRIDVWLQTAPAEGYQAVTLGYNQIETNVDFGAVWLYGCE